MKYLIRVPTINRLDWMKYALKCALFQRCKGLWELVCYPTAVLADTAALVALGNLRRIVQKPKQFSFDVYPLIDVRKTKLPCRNLPDAVSQRS
jgi:hypothetical protein